MKKLIPAIVLLLISAIVMSTASYAWFSMNKQVTATGMQVRAEVSDSLLIAPSSAGTTKANENAFVKGIDQNVKGVLQPVSTITAADDAFFYSYDAKANGEKLNTDLGVEPFIAVDDSTGANPAKVSANGGTTYAYDAYKDYVLELKVINSTNSAQELRLTALNLMYDGVVTTNHAFRVAVFDQAYNSGSYVERAGITAIYAPASAAYFESKAVSATNAFGTAPTLNGTWTKDIAGQTTTYYKVTFRLWLEGQDTDCFTEKFVELTRQWTLDIAFELVPTSGSGPAAVAQIGSAVRATATGTTAALSLPAEWADTVKSYQWYDAETNAAISGQTAVTVTGTAGDKVYCEITTQRGTVYRTNTVVLT